jgi:hypothetical protein
MSILFVGYHFKGIPLACGMGLCSNNCLTHKQKEYLQTPKIVLKKPKEREK